MMLSGTRSPHAAAALGAGVLAAAGALAETGPAAPASSGEFQTADTPAAAQGRRERTVVVTALTVGADGHASDPEVLPALPPGGFADAAVEAWLDSQLAPAQRDARPVPSRLETKTLFGDGESLASSELVSRARLAADAARSGSPTASCAR